MLSQQIHEYLTSITKAGHLDGKVEVHIPDRVDIVPDGRGPRSGGGSHREDRVWVADARAQPVLVCQVFGSEDLQNLPHVLPAFFNKIGFFVG